MALCPQHTFQLLTKRSERMLEYLGDYDINNRLSSALGCMLDGDWIWNEGKLWRDEIENLISCFLGEETDGRGDIRYRANPMPLPNVWLGVSAERQQEADERIPHLLQTPAAVRFVSCEPLLGPINLARINGGTFDALIGHDFESIGDIRDAGDLSKTQHHPGLDWVIVGGESGPGARPMHPQWARDIRDQCKAAGVPFFFKQFGEWASGYCKNMGVGEMVFRQFSSFDQWVDKASSWVNGGICLDSQGNELKRGADFMMARDENLFPVTIMHRVGKARAGRLLDGVEHSEFPDARG